MAEGWLCRSRNFEENMFFVNCVWDDLVWGFWLVWCWLVFIVLVSIFIDVVIGYLFVYFVLVFICLFILFLCCLINRLRDIIFSLCQCWIENCHITWSFLNTFPYCISFSNSIILQVKIHINQNRYGSKTQYSTEFVTPVSNFPAKRTKTKSNRHEARDPLWRVSPASLFMFPSTSFMSSPTTIVKAKFVCLYVH